MAGHANANTTETPTSSSTSTSITSSTSASTTQGVTADGASSGTGTSAGASAEDVLNARDKAISQRNAEVNAARVAHMKGNASKYLNNQEFKYSSCRSFYCTLNIPFHPSITL